jgi:hypothetical protein
MPKFVRTFKTLAFRRGVVKGEGSWLAVWLGMTGLGWLRRSLAKQDANVLRVKLEPGHRILITHQPYVPTPSRRERRRQAAAGS